MVCADAPDTFACAADASQDIQRAIHRCKRQQREEAVKLWRAKILVDQVVQTLNPYK